MTDYYSILKVTNQVSISDIKKSYKKLAKELHPDKTNGDVIKEEKFKQITEAYSVLIDPLKKQSYDNTSIYGRNYTPGFNFNGVKSTQYDYSYQEFRENLNINITLIITLRDIYKEEPFDILYKKNIYCDDCDGTGFDRLGESYSCEMCDGVGKDYFGKKCEYCQGLGKIYSGICKKCNGEKIISQPTTYNLNINNIRKSKNIIINEKGHQSRYFRNKKGNLKINIFFEKIENYELIDNDLYYKLDVHYNDAIFGNNIIYEHLDNKKLKIKIPEKTKDNDKIRLKNKGLIFGENRGDLIIIINIIINYDLIKKE